MVECGAGRASVIDFSYSRPAQPPVPNRWDRWKKALLVRSYFWWVGRA